MLQANKSLTPLLVKAILTRTAQQLPGFTNKAQSVLSRAQAWSTRPPQLK
jgi:hypothetical protein